jgi:hypothetical protein
MTPLTHQQSSLSGSIFDSVSQRLLKKYGSANGTSSRGECYPICGLCSNLDQRGQRAVQRAVQVHSGALKANEELKMITSDLKALVERFRQSFGWTSADRADHVDGGVNDTTSLETICAGIANIAEELIAKLDRLGNKDTNGRTWSTLCQVIKSAWSKEEVAQLTKRLAGFQKAVEAHVLLSIRLVFTLCIVSHLI